MRRAPRNDISLSTRIRRRNRPDWIEPQTERVAVRRQRISAIYSLLNPEIARGHPRSHDGQRRRQREHPREGILQPSAADRAKAATIARAVAFRYRIAIHVNRTEGSAVRGDVAYTRVDEGIQLPVR